MDSPSCVIRYIPPRQDPLVVRPVNYTGFIGPPLARDTALWIFRRDVQGRAGKSRQSAHTPSPISFLITQGMGGCVSDPTSDTKNRTRCCFTAGPASATLAQQQNIARPTTLSTWDATGLTPSTATLLSLQRDERDELLNRPVVCT